MTITTANESERKARRAMSQRNRRKNVHRVDFYANDNTVALLASLRLDRAGYDNSSLLNRIVKEWQTGRLPEIGDGQ